MEVTGNSTSDTQSLSFPAERSLVIDTHAHFRSIDYDAKTEIVTVGAGALLGDLNEMLERNGRAIPSGSCPTVGVGGQALAGGFGLPSRSWGLLLDNMLSVDLVTAEGKMLKASAEENQELFWVSRGACHRKGSHHTLTRRLTLFRGCEAPDLLLLLPLRSPLKHIRYRPKSPTLS
jgi:FAD/FMN-containing dehydrogenase